MNVNCFRPNEPTERSCFVEKFSERTSVAVDMASEQVQTCFSGGYFQVALVCANCCDFPVPLELRRPLRGKVEQSVGGQPAEFSHMPVGDPISPNRSRNLIFTLFTSANPCSHLLLSEPGRVLGYRIAHSMSPRSTSRTRRASRSDAASRAITSVKAAMTATVSATDGQKPSGSRRMLETNMPPRRTHQYDRVSAFSHLPSGEASLSRLPFSDPSPHCYPGGRN